VDRNKQDIIKSFRHLEGEIVRAKVAGEIYLWHRFATTYNDLASSARLLWSDLAINSTSEHLSSADNLALLEESKKVDEIAVAVRYFLTMSDIPSINTTTAQGSDQTLVQPSPETSTMTTANSIRTGVFFSHATADSEVTNDFVEKILMLGMGIDGNDIFNVSDADQGVPTGQHFVPYIRDRINRSAAIVAWITPRYQNSPFCLCELGAAWAMIPASVPFLPLIHDMGYNDLKGVLHGMQVVKADEKDKLDKFRDELAAALGIQARLKTASWNRHRDDFWREHL
jgi:hypothetical protein